MGGAAGAADEGRVGGEGEVVVVIVVILIRGTSGSSSTRLRFMVPEWYPEEKRWKDGQRREMEMAADRSRWRRGHGGEGTLTMLLFIPDPLDFIENTATLREASMMS